MQFPFRVNLRVNCAACRREAPTSVLKAVQSKLDFQIRDLCPACIEHKAEALQALVRTVNKAGWKGLTNDIRRTIRVWDMEEYVTVPVWAERMSHRQLVTLKKTEEPVLDPEDEALLQRLRNKRQEAIPPKHRAIRQEKRNLIESVTVKLKKSGKPKGRSLRNVRESQS